MFKKASRSYSADELRFAGPSYAVSLILRDIDINAPKTLAHMTEETLYIYLQSHPIIIEEPQRARRKLRKNEYKGSDGIANQEEPEGKAVFISGWSSFRLAAKLNIRFTPVVLTDSSQESIKLLAWSDLLRCLPLIDGKRVGRLFYLMKEHCPDDVANWLLGGKVTQRRLVNFLNCSLNKLQNQIKEEKGKRHRQVAKPELAKMNFEDDY